MGGDLAMLEAWGVAQDPSASRICGLKRRALRRPEARSGKNLLSDPTIAMSASAHPIRLPAREVEGDHE
jgi:hypothetical protein